MTTQNALTLVHILGQLIPMAWALMVMAITVFLTKEAYGAFTVSHGPPGWYVAWLMTATVLEVLSVAASGNDAAKDLVVNNGQIFPLLIAAGLTPWLGYKGWTKFVEGKYGKSELPEPEVDRL